MSTDERSRDATATIKGYLYQFDATILALLQMPDSNSLSIESIEDYDISNSDSLELFQCKYYAASKLTPATIRDAILPMLKGFLLLDGAARKKRNCHLYGYFKDALPEEKRLTVADLKKVLIQREHVKKHGITRMETIDLQKNLGASDQDLQDFSEQLYIHITVEFSEHNRKTIEALRLSCRTTTYEAECFLYPSARTLVSGLAAEKNATARTLTKSQFIAQVSPSKALFNIWSLREHGEKEYCACIRRDYLSERNIDTAHRLFILDSSLPATDTELISVCHTLRDKWSTHAVRRKPDEERYAPFVFFKGFQAVRVVSLKAALQADGVKFVDGYPFLGASFTVEQLCDKQTRDNGLSLRIITSEADFSSTIAAIKGRRIVFDFFKDKPTPINGGCSVISIPVTSLRMVENIV